ncbi:MAG: hypothetical protein IPL47_01440 [Phyllobacteriaceae bacterium]|nr:hypothetical protein [Phyllobacteriaceae bacterium]
MIDFMLERFSFKLNRLSAGISRLGQERNATRCAHRQRFATPSKARKTKLKRLQFANENSALADPAWRSFPLRPRRNPRAIFISRSGLLLAGSQNPCHQTAPI